MQKLQISNGQRVNEDSGDPGEAGEDFEADDEINLDIENDDNFIE